MPDQQQPPLTDEEIAEFREILIADKRAKWLGATIRTWAVWIAAVIGGAVVSWDAAVRVIKAMAGK